MIDLKTMQSALEQLETEKGVSKEQIIEAIELALAAAYKKDFGKKGQIIRAKFDMATGDTTFSQIKIAVDESMLIPEDEDGLEVEPPSKSEEDESEEPHRIRFNPEHHMMMEEARMIKKDIQPEEEVIFPLESQKDYGRIAAQTAKQVIIQKIREAERSSVFSEFKDKQGEIVSGIVQRIDNNNVFIDFGKTTAVLPRDEQIKGERYRVGERVKSLLYLVEEAPRGINLYLSRSHPQFIAKLFEMEVPEIASGVVEIKNIAREAGSRSKIAVFSNEDGVDPVGSCVGQKGIRITTVISELGGEKIDIIEWSEDISRFIANSLSPAKIAEVNMNEDEKVAEVMVDEDQLSLAIGKSGQNVRLAHKITGWKIDIKSEGSAPAPEATEDENTEAEEKTEE